MSFVQSSSEVWNVMFKKEESYLMAIDDNDNRVRMCVRKSHANEQACLLTLDTPPLSMQHSVFLQTCSVGMSCLRSKKPISWLSLYQCWIFQNIDQRY